MKIYTITFQFARNFGAIMQAYALQTYLEEQGCVVEVIDYWPAYAYKTCSWDSNLKKNLSLKNLILVPINIRSTQRVNKFKKKYLHLTKRCNTKAEVAKLPPADAIIVGSDQVWNPVLLGEYNDVYFLNFPSISIKAAYAASAGQDNFTGDAVKRFVEYANKFDFASVREMPFYKLLQANGAKQLKHVLDPVFLLNREVYHKIAKPSSVGGKYILTYYTDSQGLTDELAVKISKKNGNIPVYKVGRFFKRNSVIGLGDQSFENLLWLLENAEYIVTSSFHITAFAIIFRKQFYSVSAGQRSSRLTSLLNSFNLINRYIASRVDIEKLEIDIIDYSSSENAIAEKIERSKAYLKTIIQEVVNRRK